MLGGLYVIITNPVKTYSEIAKICVNNNVKMLQFRQKNLTDKQILTACEEILHITSGTNTKLIIDDRIDIALAANCDGVHLGQNDIPYQIARKLLPNKIIGISTHSLEQVKIATGLKPNYIGFGPIYKTPTKKIPDPVVGVNLLEQALKICSLPIVAIGGINKNNVQEVLNTGVKNICMVRYLMNYKDLEKRIQYIQNLINTSRPH